MMSEQMELQKAKEVYSALINMLDTRGWKYEKMEDDLVIRSGIKGEDLPIEFIVLVMPKNQVVQVISKLPFNIPEDKRVEAAVAVSVANYGIVDGSFDYDISDGEIRYRLTSSYRESYLGADLFEYMIMVAASTVDKYNDRFFMLSKGMITIEQFIEQDNS